MKPLPVSLARVGFGMKMNSSQASQGLWERLPRSGARGTGTKRTSNVVGLWGLLQMNRPKTFVATTFLWSGRIRARQFCPNQAVKSGLDECQEIGVEDIGVGCQHSVRVAPVDF